MSEGTLVSELALGDEISASITVRGVGMTEATGIAMAVPALDGWQRSQSGRLADDLAFEPTDRFADRPQGEHSVTRTLKVVSRA